MRLRWNRVGVYTLFHYLKELKESLGYMDFRGKPETDHGSGSCQSSQQMVSQGRKRNLGSTRQNSRLSELISPAARLTKTESTSNPLTRKQTATSEPSTHIGD